MSDLIRGAGGGGGGGVGQTIVQQVAAPQRTPVRDPDNLASKQYATFVDLLGEGEIEGFPSARSYTKGTANYNRAALKDVYLNGTAVLRAGADATNPQTSDYNYQNLTFEPRFGTQAQSYIAGFSDIEDERTVNLEVQQATPITRTITDSNTDAVRVTITVPRLEKYEDNGDVLGTSISLSIQVQYNGGGYSTVLTDTISGRTADQYQRDYKVDLAGAFPVDVRVVRNTEDSGSSNLINTFYWSSYTEIIYEKLRYPNSALVAMRLDAEQFSSIPSRSYRVRGIKVQIPSNGTVDQTNGRITYSGTWDGTFGAAVWTSDPAWVLWNLLTSTRYGFGDHVAASQLDKWAFYSASQYASSLVPDGFGGEEPRFSCNALIQNQDEAFKLINDLCSVMRVMPYWATGTLTISQDKPTDSSYLFTLSNVTEDGFSYSGSSLKTRHTVAVVSYLDLDTQDLAYEVVEDKDGISKYGVITTEIKAFACTSRGQAARLGEWMLYSEQYETEVVSFTASIDAGVLVRPGQVISIADPVRAGVRRGGRISSATTTSVTVDDASELQTGAGVTLSVLMPDGTIETKPVDTISGNVITLSAAFSTAPNTNSIWVQNSTTVEASTWRVLSVEERESSQYLVNALAYNPSKYDYIERDRELQQRSISVINEAPAVPTNLQSAETLYDLNGRAAVKLIISWRAVVGVSLYRVQWKRGDGNWTTIEVPRPDYEILDTAADTYYVRVYSLNGVRTPSNVPAELKIDALGKTALPVDVTGTSLIPIDSASAILSWNRATDLDVLLGGKVLIRHSTVLSGAEWQKAQTIVPSASGNQTQKQVPLLEGTYLLRFEDDGGRISANASLVIADLPSPQERSLVQYYREDTTTPPFQGNVTDLFYSEEQDGLILANGVDVDDLAPGGDWDAEVGTIDAAGGMKSSGEYEFGSTLDLGATFDLNMTRHLVTRGFLPGDLWDDRTALIDDWTELIDGSLPENVNALLYVRTTTDDPSGTPTWGTWREFSNGINRGRGFQFKVIATSGSTDQNIVIDELGVRLELQQRVQQGGPTTTGTSGPTSVTFPNAFYVVPAVGVTAYDMHSNDDLQITNVTRTGFQIEFKHGASTQAHTFTYSAVGYGKEIV